MLRVINRIPKKNFEAKFRRDAKLYKTPERCYSEKVCPPPPKNTSSGGIYTLGALALAGAATLAYAKHDPDFRRTIVAYVPVVDKVIAVVFQEETNYLATLSNFYESLKKTLGKLLEGRKEVIKETTKPYTAPSPIVQELEDTRKPRGSYSEIRLEKKDNPECEIGGKPKEELPVSETHPSNLAELEEKICQAATDAVNAYNKAIYNLKIYNQELSVIIDEAVDEIPPSTWENIKTKTRSKNESIVTAKAKGEDASEKIARLKHLLSRPDFDASPATREMVKQNIKKVQDDIEEARKSFEAEQRLGTTTELYWDKVQKARQQFAEELEAIFPTVDINKKKLDIDPAEVDLFLLYAYQHLVYYQKEVSKLETLTQERIKAAVESVKRGGGEALTTAQICEAIDHERRRLLLDYQKQCLKLRKDAEQNLRDQLKRQSQVFTDHLDEAIKCRSLEIERTIQRKFDEKLEAETIKYKTQLAAMVSRFKGADEALRARENLDKTAKRSQVLWSACQSLLRAIKTGCPGIPWKDQLRPLNPEICLVRKAAAPNDDLVDAVISAIPAEAKERGVFPEDALRERFIKVEDMARRLALVPAEGASLPIHILSYIQYMCLIKDPSPIPVAELNDESVAFDKLTTNEILQRARYWIDRGNFSQALKYMNLLEGASRSISRQWMNEARILLETQQAANTLMAHAASSGLLHL